MDTSSKLIQFYLFTTTALIFGSFFLIWKYFKASYRPPIIETPPVRKNSKRQCNTKSEKSLAKKAEKKKQKKAIAEYRQKLIQEKNEEYYRQVTKARPLVVETTDNSSCLTLAVIPAPKLNIESVSSILSQKQVNKIQIFSIIELMELCHVDSALFEVFVKFLKKQNLFNDNYVLLLSNNSVMIMSMETVNDVVSKFEEMSYIYMDDICNVFNQFIDI